MAFVWIVLPLLVLMAGNYGEGPSRRSKQKGKEPKEPSARGTDRKEMTMEDIEKRAVVYEHYYDIEDINSHMDGLMDLIQAQSWEVAFLSSLGEKIALPQIFEFYHSLEKVNEGYYKAKVCNQVFHLRSGMIAQLLGVPDDGDKTYFDNISLEFLLTNHVEQEELDNLVVQSGTILSNPTKARDLTKMAFVLWELVSTNILPQVGHHSELSSYAVFTLWRILSGRQINLPSLILSHMWRCRNQKRACLPYGRLLSALFFHARPSMEERTTTSLPIKIINYGSLFNKLVGREGKKRKTHVDATTSREEPIQEEEDSDWLDDAARAVDDVPPPSSSHGDIPPPIPSYAAWHDLCTRVDHISISLGEIRRDQEIFYRHMSSHLGLPLTDYSFYHPPPPHDAPRDPSEGGGDEE